MSVSDGAKGPTHLTAVSRVQASAFLDDLLDLLFTDAGRFVVAFDSVLTSFVGIRTLQDAFRMIVVRQDPSYLSGHV